MAQRKRNVQFAKPEEPAFLKKLKAQCGFTAGPDVDTKKEELEKADKRELEDNDDEQPVIVVLKKGDLSEEEVQKIKDENKQEDEDDISDGKIVFRKPSKEQLEKKTDTFQNTFKNQTKAKSTKESQHQSKSVKNSRLLSFDDEEEDE